MYVAHWAVCSDVAEEEHARKAYDLTRMSDYPSVSELIHLIEDGNIRGMPSLTCEDVLHAYDLFGMPPAYVRGKMTKRAIKHEAIDDNLMITEEKQKLYTDVMKNNGAMFLITVCDPLHLILSTPIERETANQLGLALPGQLNVLRSHGFVPTIVFTDPAPGFQSLVNQFPGVILDTGGAKDNVTKVDIKIRRIKELCRSIQASLSWPVTKTMVNDLVSYAVARLQQH